MKKTVIFGLTLFCFSSLFAQSAKSSSHPFLFSSHGFNSIYLDPAGYNPVFSTFSGNPAYSNPAGFSDDGKIHIWGKWAKNSEIKDAWLGFGYRQLKPELPSGLGVSIPLYGLTFTAGYSRSLNYTFFAEDVDINIYNSPVSTYNFYDDARLDMYSISVSGNLKVAGSEENNLALGLTLKYGVETVRSEFLNIYFDSDDEAISFAFGAIYMARPLFAEKMRIGFFAETAERYSGQGTFKTKPGGTITPAKINDPIVIQPVRFEGNLPTRLHAGAEITYHSGIQSFLQASLIMREKSGFISKNQIELSGSVLYPVTESVSVSGGLLWDSWLVNKDSGLSVKNKDFQSVFITTGVQTSLYGILINFSLADNHLLAGKYRKQTILTAGVGYEF